MGLTQVKPEVQERLHPLYSLREEAFFKIKDKLTKMVCVNAVHRINKFEISQIFDIPVVQAGMIEIAFNSKIKRSKQPDQIRGNPEAQVPALSESRVSLASSNVKPTSRVAHGAMKQTNAVFNSIDTTELLMTLILCSEIMKPEEKCSACLNIINAGMFPYLTFSELKLAFRYSYKIIKHLTDLNLTTCDLENFLYNNYIFTDNDYYKDKQVDMELLTDKISKHKNFKELIEVFTARYVVDLNSQEEYKDDDQKSSNQKMPPSTRRTKGDGSDISLGKFSFTKPLNSVKTGTHGNLYRNKDDEIESIQELQSDKSGAKRHLESVNSGSPTRNRSKNTLMNQKHQNVKSKRDEEEQNSRMRQLQLEAAQIHMEDMKFNVEKKIYLKSEEYTKALLHYMTALKLKIQDSYYVASVPFMIDSIMFEEDLRNREVSLISESLMKITRKVPKTPRNEDEEILSNKAKGKGKDEEESKVAYEDEEVTMVDEKRLQILTAITFRDLFAKKVKILEMRKKELFYQSLVYLDYDVVKIINIKNKSMLVGQIHELQKAWNKMQVENQNDDMSSVNNDGSKKLTLTFMQDKSVYLYDKLEKLDLRKADLVQYKDLTQQIKEFLALKCYYQGCKTVLNEVSNIRAFDGIPLLIDYQEYVGNKESNDFKEAQNKRQEVKSKILKYMTLVGRIKAVQFIVRNFEKPQETQ